MPAPVWKSHQYMQPRQNISSSDRTASRPEAAFLHNILPPIRNPSHRLSISDNGRYEDSSISMKPCDAEILTYSKRSPRILDMFGIRENDSVTISDFCYHSGVHEVREM